LKKKGNVELKRSNRKIEKEREERTRIERRREEEESNKKRAETEILRVQLEGNGKEVIL
jgi:hypothetical protein